MFPALVCAALLCALAWLRVRWTNVRAHWQTRGVPYHPPHPLLGSLTFLQKVNPGLWMRDIYNEFRAPYVGIWLFWRPALVINCPEIARRVLVKDADNFRNRFLSSGKRDPIGALNIFTVNDPVWSSVRRRLTATFTSARLRALQSFISIKAKELTQRIKSELDQKKVIDIRSVYADYTTDLIGTSSFGVASDATLTGDSPMRRVTKDFQTFTQWRGLGWSSIFFLPELVDVFRFSLFPKAATEYFVRVFRSVVAQRGGYDRAISEKGDLLDALLKMKQDAAKDNEEMDEMLLISQAAILVQGGFDTSSSALTFLSNELAHKPEVQERLHAELSEAKEKLGDADFDMTALAELTYLNCVIKECLRKYPPMGWLDRIASSDYKIDDKLTIPAGTPIYVNSIGMMMDPDYFPDPYNFDPDRFLPENEKNIKPFTYIPFGEGPRICIGMRFAQQSMRFALASLILNFRMLPFPTTPKPDDCAIENKGMLFLPGEPVNLDFVPRN